MIPLVFLIEERLRGEIELSRFLAGLKAKGVSLDVDQLKPEPPRPEDNAFMVLTILTNCHEALLTNLDAGPPSMGFAKPGTARISWLLDGWEVEKNKTNNWPGFGKTVEESGGVLALLQSAAAKAKYNSGFDHHQGFLDFKIGPLHTPKRAVQVLSAAMLHELRNHRNESAYSNLCAAVRLVDMREPEPLVICQLVRLACETLTFNATWQVLQAQGWNDEQLANLQRLWEGPKFPEDLAAAMEMERALTFRFYTQIKGSRDDLRRALEQRESVVEVLDGESGYLVVRGALLHHLHAPLWRLAWSSQDELRSLQRWEVMVERMRFAQSNSWAALCEQAMPDNRIPGEIPWLTAPENVSLYDRARFLFSNDTFSITDVLIRRALQAQVLQQLAVTAIAIERYRLANGEVPKDLGQLIPRFLSKIPQDGMNGGALHYLRHSASEFLLYSVGEDGKDDGGDPSLRTEKKSYRQIWDGKDAVWPNPSEEDSSSRMWPLERTAD